MKYDPAIITALQSSCQTFAHLAEQFRVDGRQLDAMGIEFLACRFKKMYSGSECYLEEFIDRLLYGGQDPEYSAGSVSGASSITEILNRAQTLTSSAMEAMIGYRKLAWDTRADYTTDLFEHAICKLEKMEVKINRELALLLKLGEEAYIGARIPDGD